MQFDIVLRLSKDSLPNTKGFPKTSVTTLKSTRHPYYHDPTGFTGKAGNITGRYRTRPSVTGASDEKDPSTKKVY